MSELVITIMAGGLGKRMLSETPKVLMKVKGEAMIIRLLREVITLNPNKILIVVGKFRTQIQNEIEQFVIDERISYIDQPMPRGTGDAIRCTLPEFDAHAPVTNIILNGDVPLLKSETIRKIHSDFVTKSSTFMITAIKLDEPTGNGRIILDNNNKFIGIVEEKDCDAQQKELQLVNVGIYCCTSNILLDYIPQITNDNAQSEYYLTDLVKICSNAGQLIDLYTLPKESQIEIYNVNTRNQLNYIENAC